MSDYSHRKKNKQNLKEVAAASFYPKNQHNNSTNRKRNEIKSKTPPLPDGKTSIVELKKKHETIRKELAKLSKHSDGNLDKYKSNKLEKNCNADTYKNNSRKRKNGDYDNKYSKNDKRMPIIKDTSPERNGDGAQTDSEDEDNIIEKRRQQRKKLLEDFNKNKNKPENDIHRKLFPIAKNNEYTNTLDIETKQNIALKETPDMFSDRDDFTLKLKVQHTNQNNEEQHKTLQDNWDDTDGYYKIQLGEAINNNRFIIKSILGKGVFANVVKAEDSNEANKEVAIKIIRHNELMYKTGLKEISILKEIGLADPENKQHCIKIHSYFKHKGHLCLVMEPLYMDLRNVIGKYSKYHGLSLQALMTYTKQLFVALRLLKKIGVIHADIKPDNILVNEKKNILKLCDFGSATRLRDGIDATAYFVSRFYRAPEIILGIPYKHSVDVWSAACTIFEMATSKILFTGNCNNNMLKCFMDLKGKFPAKLINKGTFKDKHFNYNNNFLLHKKDELTGKDTVIEMSNVNIHRNLQKELKKSYKNLTDNEIKKLAQLKDLIDKMLTIDLAHRLTINDCFKHPFIVDNFRK